MSPNRHRYWNAVFLVVFLPLACWAGGDFPKVDLDGDGVADVFYSDAFSGALRGLKTRKTSGVQVAYGRVEPTRGWSGLGLGDIDGDGITDLLWYHNPTGTVGAWLLEPNGTYIWLPITKINPDTGWAPAAYGDLDGNGQSDDLLWYNISSYGLTLSKITGGGLTFTNYGGVDPRSGWVLIAFVDVNADGFHDFVWYNRFSRQTVAWLLTSSGALGYPHFGVTGGEWVPAATGDFDGDGRADLVWMTSHGDISIMLLSEYGRLGLRSIPRIDPKDGWSLFAIVDLNSDGVDDFVLRHSNGSLKVWLLSQTGFDRQILLGRVDPATGWIPLGFDDFDGDSTPDLFWYNSVNTTIAAQLMDANGSAGFKGLGSLPNSEFWVVSIP